MAKERTTARIRPILHGILYIIAYVAWVYLVFQLCALIFGILIRLIAGSNVSAPLWTTIYEALTYVATCLVVAIVPIFIAKKRRKVSSTPLRESLGLKGLPTFVDIGLAPVGFIIYFLLAAVLTALFSNFSWFNPSEVQEVGFNNYLYGSDLIIAFVALVVIAPIAEEIIFRGWLYHKLRVKITSLISKKNARTRNIISIIISTIITSAFFGLLHGQWNVAVNVFALSVVLCAFREITGTIYSGIILHMLKNGIAFYLLYILHASA